MTGHTEIALAATVAPAPPAIGPSVDAIGALDRGELPRMRVFGQFGIIAGACAIGLTVPLGGDPFARQVFWFGAALLIACNAWLSWMASSPARYRPRPVAAVWIGSTLGLLPAILYFGPLSGVVVAPLLGITIVSLGRSLWLALAVLAIVVVGYSALAIPIAIGWTEDRGVLHSVVTGHTELLVSAVLILFFYGAGFALGRWVRRTNTEAVVDLQKAMRMIGDQQVVLAEVKADAARAERVGEGRWTGHKMGSFELGLVLGRGGMGEVYEALSPNGMRAAVKMLSATATPTEQLIERFHREIEIAARLESPHIVKVLEVSPPTARVPFLAMERLYGTDLNTRLRSTSRMPIEDVASLLGDVARGLEVAHHAGVVHRDLKPHNLFLHRQDHAQIWKILDFGVSKLIADDGSLTGEAIVGTPQYMAPEQVAGDRVTPAADIYAIGAVAYRCLTGRPPLAGSTFAEILYRAVDVAPPRPSLFTSLPRAIEDVLAVAMAKAPERRFDSPRAFAAAFAAAQLGQPSPIAAPLAAWSDS